MPQLSPLPWGVYFLFSFIPLLSGVWFAGKVSVADGGWLVNYSLSKGYNLW